MTTRPTAVPPSAPPPRRGAPDRLLRLQQLARALLAVAASDPGPAELVGVAEAADGDVDDGLVLVTIPGPDPAAGLLGFTAPPDWWAVGVLAEGRARSLEPEAGPADDGYQPFVHLVARDGTGVGLLHRPGADPLVMGPYAEPVAGRTADACRRVLDLTTAPPPPTAMTSHLVDVWLDRVAHDAVEQGGLGWADVVARHPACDVPPVGGTPTPAQMAARTLEWGSTLDWDRYRIGCAARGAAPFGDLDRAAIEWMDAGMFARWQLGESLRRVEQMDLLDALLPTAAADLLGATVALCRPSGWPPG